MYIVHLIPWCIHKSYSSSKNNTQYKRTNAFSKCKWVQSMSRFFTGNFNWTFDFMDRKYIISPIEFLYEILLLQKLKKNQSGTASNPNMKNIFKENFHLFFCSCLPSKIKSANNNLIYTNQSNSKAMQSWFSTDKITGFVVYFGSFNQK